MVRGFVRSAGRGGDSDPFRLDTPYPQFSLVRPHTTNTFWASQGMSLGPTLYMLRWMYRWRDGWRRHSDGRKNDGRTFVHL